MGITADQFWNSSRNGKAMLLMSAKRGDVEFVRDACDWLVKVRRDDLALGAIEQGATADQAKAIGYNGVSGLQSGVDGINDRNCVASVTSIVDEVFAKHYNAGKPQYDKAMAWFADQLRKRAKD